MPLSQNPLALHTWSLDTTPLADVLEIARSTGWDAVELRRLDFDRADAAGQSEAEVLDLVRRSGVAVSAVGVAHGWMFAEGAEREQLLATFERSCAAAAELGSCIVMSPVDREPGEVDRAAASVCEVGAIAARYGVRLALEFNSQVAQFNTLESLREVLARAAQPACGLLLDTYHLQRSGRPGRGFTEVAPEEIAYVQFSDVPRDGLQPGYAVDRLPPGQGVVDFPGVFALLEEKAYSGPLSFEGPNPAAWARDPKDVAREVLQATRALTSAS
ncbi:MAG: sugar phosphate isomerase/epimerase [Chloroflexi bacterium]|nr:sugar phosphate isomerase/epimerase [Chloroflexota bacterium]MBV9598316.1 sugar phosphate isomerase/epimerase [Chloroflexota bacterium]